MSVEFTKYVEDIDTVLLTYDQIRLFRDVSPTGDFSTAVTTATLVAGQTLYDLSDSSGNANYVYVVDFYHSTLGNTSPPSAPFYPEGYSLLRLRVDAARKANAGWDSTCSALGTATTLVDAPLLDNGVDADFAQGVWLYRPNAALATDRVRRVALSGFDTTTGAFTVSRPWSNAPAANEVYHAFLFYPPTDGPGAGASWDRIIRDAFHDLWYVDQIDLGTGTATMQRRFSLTDVADVARAQVRRVLIRCFDANNNPFDRDAGSLMGVWQFVEDGPGSVSIDVYPAPITTEHVIAEVNRQPAPIYNDTDVMDIDAAYARAAVVRRLFWQLNSDQPGKYAGELAMAQQDLASAATPAPNAVIRGL